MKNIELCPVSSLMPRATVDGDGWCSEHGWDCDDFQLYLDDEARRAQAAAAGTQGS